MYFQSHVYCHVYYLFIIQLFVHHALCINFIMMQPTGQHLAEPERTGNRLWRIGKLVFKDARAQKDRAKTHGKENKGWYGFLDTYLCVFFLKTKSYTTYSMCMIHIGQMMSTCVLIEKWPSYHFEFNLILVGLYHKTQICHGPVVNFTEQVYEINLIANVFSL